MTRLMQRETLVQLSQDLATLTRETAKSVVSVEGNGTRASGFVWRPGWIVTAEEALGEEAAGEAGHFDVAMCDGTTAKATVRGRDATTDVALLKLDRETGTPPAAAGAAEAGSLALVVGAAAGRPTTSFGAVATVGGAWRSMRGGQIDARIELSLRLDRAAQGGLAVMPDGQVLGMAALGPRRRVLVIPWDTVERAAARLLEHGRIPRGWLGVGLQPVTLAGERRRGAMVLHLDPDGPAAKAGMYQGDIIVSLGGQPLGRADQLQAALGPNSIGRVLTLGLRRAGTESTLDVTVAEKPAA